MPRRKQEINPKSSDRLKKICDGKPLTQAQLSQKTGISQNTLSKIANGKAPMSSYVAQEIAIAVSGIRKEWLMGYDDFKTEEDRISAIIGKNYSRKDLINNLISLHGYVVNDVTSLQPVQNGEDGCEYQDAKLSITSPKGDARCLSPKEFDDLLKTIDDYIEMQLLFRFRKLNDGAKEYWG